MSIFNPIVSRYKVSRNTHDLSHNHLTTIKMSRLTPVSCVEVMPGDRVEAGNIAIARFQPMFAPVMQRLKLKFVTFYVPYRALYDMWMKFIPSAGQYDLDPSKVKEFPKCSFWGLLNQYFRTTQIEAPSDIRPFLKTNSRFLTRSLLARFRYSFTSKPLSIAPILAYQYIWSEYFRNQNLQDEIDADLIWRLEGNQDDNDQLFDHIGGLELRNVNWSQDYLTASQPWTQKGKEVVIPIEASMPQFMLEASKELGDSFLGGSSGLSSNLVRNVLGRKRDGSDLVDSISNQDTVNLTFQAIDPETRQPVSFRSELTINDLRWSNALQKLLERRAAGGTRYVEYLLMEHSTKVSDKIARRPEYVCGSSIPIQIGEVLQTSASETDSALGRLAGSGYAKGTLANGHYYCDEHGILMTLAWMMPHTAYMYGMPRYLTKTEPLDFPLPAFQHLGLQEVYNYEAGFCNDNDPDGTFGYMGRYDDMRTHLDLVSGNFINNLKEWHMARNNQDVNLNDSFIKASPGTINRVFNVTDTDDDDVLLNIHHHLLIKRNLSKYAIPKL